MSKSKTAKQEKQKAANSKKSSAKDTKYYSPALTTEMSMHEKFTTIFVIGMFTLFPLFMTDKLFNLRKDRLHFFVGTTVALLFFIVATYLCGIDKKKWIKNVFKPTVEDIGMLMFLVVIVVSTLLSEYGMEAVTGSEGRDSGLIIMLGYVLCFFLVSRYYNYRKLPYEIFVITASIIVVLAILHEFYMDPFGLLTEISDSQKDIFISTIGNINIFSCFICISMPVIAALLVTSKDTASTVFYSIALCISFMGLLVANSDSGYFGLAAFMSILFVYSCKNLDRLFKFMLCVSLMALSCKIFKLFTIIFHEKYKPLDTIPMTLIFSSKIYIVLAAAAVLTIALYFARKQLKSGDLPKACQVIAGIFVAICALSLLSAFIYFSAIDKTTDLGGLTKYLRLNDKWGTHRGYAWIRSVILFKTNGVKNMLVGSGPDTFGQLIKKYYRDDMIARHGSVFDSAHNEFLTYLVTIGALGLIAYLTVLISVIIKGIRRFEYSEGALITTLVVIAYCAQSMFSLFTPIVTPYLFVFVALCDGIIRRTPITPKKTDDK